MFLGQMINEKGTEIHTEYIHLVAILYRKNSRNIL